MKKKTIYIIAGVIAVVVLCILGTTLAGLARFKKIIPEIKEQTVYTVGDEIEAGSKDVLVGESATRELYINPETMNLIVKDKAGLVSWQAIFPDAQNELEKSLLIVNYLGKDNSFSEWNSFAQVVENASYTLNRLENGVSISMNFNEGASNRFYEYLPQKMTYEHYDKFTEGLSKAVSDGLITEAQSKKYLNTLKIFYKKSKENECYICTAAGNPTASASKQLIEMAELVGYTRDDLMDDARTFNFKVEFKEPAEFDIVLNVVLSEDELIVNVPADKVVSKNDFYTIHNIEVLPNFGAVKQVKKEGSEEFIETEGYLLIPDGSGALMEMNTYDSKVPDYIRPVYNNDWYKDFRYIPEYETEIMMPIFGLIYNKGQFNPSGFLAIIESGADYCQIEAMLASDDPKGVGRLYNKVYCSYDTAQYEWVPVFGEFSTNTSTYLSVSPQTTEDLTVRYKLYDRKVSYYEMAVDYREYLFGKTQGMRFANESGLFLETYGTLSTTKKFIGIPYNSRYAMTTYEELAEIIKDLAVKNINISYLGAFDGGKNNVVMNEGKLVRQNGSEKELEALQKVVSEYGSEIYFGTSFMRVFDTSGNGFRQGVHANEDYTKTPYTDYKTNVSVGRPTSEQLPNSIVKPVYLLDVVEDFFKNTKVSGINYYVADLPNHYYADYGNNYTSPTEAQAVVDAALDLISKQGKAALDSPRADKLVYGDVCVDVPRNSSEYSSFYCTIPFYQLVINGMCEYTTTKANNTSLSADYYLMQALETGAELKFMISAKSVDILRDTEYSHLYSMQYELIKDDIKATLAKYREARKLIGTPEIVNHEILADNVFLTEYRNGTKVYTNYNGIEKTIDDIVIDAYGYVVR